MRNIIAVMNTGSASVSRSLVDGAGNVVESYEYEPYGMPTVYTSTGATLPARESAYGNRHLYTGREWDAEHAMREERAKSLPPPHSSWHLPDLRAQLLPLRYLKSGSISCRRVFVPSSCPPGRQLPWAGSNV